MEKETLSTTFDVDDKELEYDLDEIIKELIELDDMEVFQMKMM